MRVLLISPLTHYHIPPDPSWIPLGLASIGAALQQNHHNALVVDRHALQWSLGPNRAAIDSVMLDQIRRFQPDIIGLQTVSPLISDTLHCVEKIRGLFKGVLVAGGHHATAMPKQTLERISGLDCIALGEGEQVLSDLAGGKHVETIKGLVSKSETGNIFIDRSANKPKDLDMLPFPAFELLDMQNYTRPTFNPVHGHYLSCISLLTARGCPRKCAFCTESLTFGDKVRFHSPSYVLELIQKCVKDFSVSGFSLLDNDFLLDRERAVSICEKIITHKLHKKIKWAAQTRVDAVDAEILALLKKSGCAILEFGMESHNQNQLDRVHKKTMVWQNEKAVELCHKVGISVFASIMTGFEGEEIADLEAKLAWVKKVKPDVFRFSKLAIHPGSLLYQEKGAEFFEKHQWDLHTVQSYYQQIHLANYSRREQDHWFRKRYRPYQTFRRRLHMIKVNPFSKWPAIASGLVRKRFISF